MSSLETITAVMHDSSLIMNDPNLARRVMMGAHPSPPLPPSSTAMTMYTILRRENVTIIPVTAREQRASQISGCCTVVFSAYSMSLFQARNPRPTDIAGPLTDCRRDAVPGPQGPESTFHTNSNSNRQTT